MQVIFKTVHIGSRNQVFKDMLLAEKAFHGSSVVQPGKESEEVAKGLLREHLLGELLEKEFLNCAKAKANLIATFTGPCWEEFIQKNFDPLWNEIADYQYLSLSKLRLRMAHLQ